MKTLHTKAVAFIIGTLVVFSCYYDSEEALYPQLSSACDTLNISFSSTIMPILSNNCLSCHSDANASFGGGVHLQSPADVRANTPKIIPAIERSGPKPMPPNGRLKACSVSQFKIWALNGMPLN
ncbi:MAG TPA: hypothetical protein VHO68_03940 [Bacteroidales bacterium]|nr:hypothetical protein [Bacteroidales bacterium]